jgi:hypothetical protein
VTPDVSTCLLENLNDYLKERKMKKPMVVARLPIFIANSAPYYQRKVKFGGMEVSDVHRLKELEEESGKLKRTFADLGLKKETWKDAGTNKL